MPPAERHTDDVGALHVEHVEQSRRVLGKVGEPVAGRARLVGDRTAGVPQVVADDEAPAGGEAPAELLVP